MGLLRRLRRQTVPAAEPGDPANDLDIADTVIVSVVYDGDQSGVISFANGHGWWDECSHTRTTITDAYEAEYTFRYDTAEPGVVNALIEHLDEWCADATPLRIAMHPDRKSTLVDEATGESVTLPRS